MADNELLSFWDAQMTAAGELRGWYHRLYRDIFPRKRVLEIGFGLGFDGITFLEQGVDWTFCDIAHENISVIQRIARLKGLSANFLHLSSAASFDAIPGDFDVLWCLGSLHHAPFALAAEESRLVLAHLKPGGRWIELTYPRERWVREGSQAFEQWGNSTDGAGTPWAEWYDLQKLKERLFPYKFSPILDVRLNSENFIWFDLEYRGQQYEFELRSLKLAVPRKELKTPRNLWDFAWSTDIGDDPFGVPARAHIQCKVSKGSIGFAFERASKHVSREVLVDARESRQFVQVDIDKLDPGTRLSMRNCSGAGASVVQIESLELRQAI